MGTWQVVAGLAAITLVATGANLLRENRWPSQTLFVLLLVPIPAAGLALYALDPGSLPTLTAMTVIALVLLVLGIHPTFYSFMDAQGWRGGGSKTRKDLVTLNRYMLARRACGLFGVVGLLFNFEPAFAYGDLAVVLLWTVQSIPRERRAIRYDFSGEVRADAQAVFRFIVEPANWSRYSPTEFLRSEPEGPLAVGTIVTVRTLVSTTGEPADGYWIIGRSKISALTATSFTRESVAGHRKVGYDVRPVGSAALVTQRSEAIVALTDAMLGLTLNQHRELERARIAFDRGIDSVNQLMAAPQP